MAKKVTIQQIANYAGVSNFVVSRALSGKEGVKTETKERVFAAASKLGYFNQKGKYPKSLVTSSTSGLEKTEKRNIIIVMPSVRNQLKESTYWGAIIDGMSAYLDSLHINTVIVTETYSDSVMNLLNPDGFLGLIGVGEVSTSLLLEVEKLGLPVVLIDHEDPLSKTDIVMANNFDASYDLTQYLVGIGHKQFVFIGNRSYSRSFFDRWLGFRTVLEQAQQEVEGITFDLIEERGSKEMFAGIEAYFHQRERATYPTVAVCANDSIAVHLYKLVSEWGLSIPTDLSVTGFDHVGDTHLLQPTLTTVDVPKEELGKRAVELLLHRAERPTAAKEKIFIQTDILYRDSVRKIEYTNKSV